jgi:hypothetical protein
MTFFAWSLTRFFAAAVYTRHAIPFGHSYLHSLKFKEESVLMTAGGGAGDVDSSSSDDEATNEASIAKAMIAENYYEILGLGEYGCNATDDQIRKACKTSPCHLLLSLLSVSHVQTASCC